eukprot:288634-Amphidinium_carterae.1
MAIVGISVAFPPCSTLPRGRNLLELLLFTAVHILDSSGNANMKRSISQHLVYKQIENSETWTIIVDAPQLFFEKVTNR